MLLVLRIDEVLEVSGACVRILMVNAVFVNIVHLFLLMLLPTVMFMSLSLYPVVSPYLSKILRLLEHCGVDL